jgi:glutamate decarboxylase
MLSKKRKLKGLADSEKGHSSTYSTRYFTRSVPKHVLPEKGMPADAAYQLVSDELNLDGNAALNLASFVNTWMEPEARKLIDDSIHKNFIDHDEYPQTEVIHERCVNMLARLFHAPEESNSVGAGTVGSSEAIMLALLSHKWTWRKRREKEQKPTDKPNIVFGADTHVCWDKFARYFDVEPRIIPLAPDRFTISADEIAKQIDENTICVGAILGTTFTGQSDPIEEINDLLVNVKKERGLDIPLHVDAASGGFVAPFVKPKLKWDFRLAQVKSINVSGHKYGLVYPGVGWVIFRDEVDLPKDLIFKVNYLGGEMPTFTLNFSRGSAMIIAQYYNLLRLGREGYERTMTNTVENARYLGKRLAESGRFDMLNEAQLLPIVAFKLKGQTNFSIFELSEKVRQRGWIIAAYTLPKNAEQIAIMRVVVRENFSRDMAEMLCSDIIEACDELRETGTGMMPPSAGEEGSRHIC